MRCSSPPGSTAPASPSSISASASPPASWPGCAAGAVLALVVGALALRTSGVAFMIVTMMFSQVFYLSTLYFAAWTQGDEGFVLPQPARQLAIGDLHFDLTQPTTRYMAALSLFAAALAVTLFVVRSAHGRVLVAIRENEERTRMLGYDAFANKLCRAGPLGRHLGCRGGGLRALVRLCRVDLRFGPVQHLPSAVGAARRRGDDARAAASARC